MVRSESNAKVESRSESAARSMEGRRKLCSLPSWLRRGLFEKLTLPALLGSLKPVFDDSSPTADDDAFVAALPIVSTFIEAQIRNITAKARAQSIVLDAIAAAGSSAILELPMGMPYAAALDQAGADHILFVVCPRGEE